MQIKTLALAAVAVVAVSAQTFDNNTCTQCVYGSFSKDTSCAALNSTELAQLEAAFSNNTVNPLAIAAANQVPAIHTCICHWAQTAFTSTGAAGSCISGTTPTCNSTQVGEAEAGISGLNQILSCAASTNTTGGSTATGSATGSASTATATTKPSGASIQMKMPYVLSVAAIGLAALAGF
ncbi:hypothetical protein EDD21DRAFT_415908 [Dissophora ornata]|nr:hypothetical protein BGZ58_009228 [Dissophora ornata]KAI8600380.1 hypothetical protein EDD21DRAFT_415908 [Dissophora ornata]